MTFHALQDIGPANPPIVLKCALDDNLAAAKHGIPGSSDSLAINADAFDHRQLEALGSEVTEKSLLVTRTALTQYLEQRIPKPWALKDTIENQYSGTSDIYSSGAQPDRWR